MLMPIQLLGVWLRALLVLVLLTTGTLLLGYWYNHRHTEIVRSVEPAPSQPPGSNRATPPPREEVIRVDWQFGFNRETAALLGGLALLGWSFGGGWALRPGLLGRRADAEPPLTTPHEIRRIDRPGGRSLHVELYGTAGKPAIVLTHGWGLDREEWRYARKELGDRFRLITWDLPGLGKSDAPADRDWALERLAADLGAVVELAGPSPVILLGHSIGGMIALTYCKLFPQALGTRVSGLVLAHSTYTNPVRTTAASGFYMAIQKPILEPLCHLMVWLSPVFRALNWLSYLNGSAHRSTERSTFSGQESRQQLDFLTRYTPKVSPAVIGRGMLAMFRYDATSVLRTIPVPTLVVVGDQDRQTTAEAGEFMRQAIPEAELYVIRSARHGGLFEHHGSFHAKVADFVTACAMRMSGPRPVRRAG